MQELSPQRTARNNNIGTPYTRPVSSFPASIPARRKAGSTSFLCATENEQNGITVETLTCLQAHSRQGPSRPYNIYYKNCF